MIFGFLRSYHALGFFRVIAVTLREPFGITFCTPRVQNAHVTCDTIIQDTSEVYFYILT